MTTKTQTKHTPTPFDQGYNDNQTIWADYKRIATMECSNKNWKANAEFIVKCCNSHYELVEALKEVQDYMQRNEHFLPETQDREEIASIVIEALKKAKG